MQLIGQVRLSLWVVALGTIVLYAFFLALARVPLAQVAGTTTAIAILAALVTIRCMRVASVLADRGGDPRVRRALNRQRERRGF